MPVVAIYSLVGLMRIELPNPLYHHWPAIDYYRLPCLDAILIFERFNYEGARTDHATSRP
jgi:hypothetical protein